MKKLLLKSFYPVLFVCIILVQSCQNNLPEDIESGYIQKDTIGHQLAEFSPVDLEDMSAYLANNGIVVEADTTELRTKGIFVNSLTVSALKVSCKYPNPSGAGYVDMSGVILVPKMTLFTRLINQRLIIAPPPTYTNNKKAPSNIFKRVSLVSQDSDLNFLYFWTLQARLGYVVLIPDYLGFGDSHGQCFHPYIEAKPMVKSVLELTKAAKSLLSFKGYRYKKEVIVTGYSLGGFIAASLVRELETTSNYNIPVSLLVTGGTPCYLKQIADGVRASDEVDASHLLPYAIWGYKKNGYPQINTADILKEPYASTSWQYFDGTYDDVVSKLPNKVRDLYTDKFIDYLDIDPSISYIKDILDDNSVKPWRNKCRFIMTHGTSDITVYYQNAADFATDQKKIGSVTFYPTIGTHIGGVLPYYIKASEFISRYR